MKKFIGTVSVFNEEGSVTLPVYDDVDDVVSANAETTDSIEDDPPIAVSA